MKVEILRPPLTSFVVGRDLVGYAKVGNDPDVWDDLISNAGAFRAQRGGTTTPKVNALDVGTLSVPLKGMDPETDSRLRVGRRLRLVDEERGDRVLWFGRLSDIPATDEPTYMVTTLAATDPVDELGNAMAKGIGVPGEVETLRSRVERLSALSTVPLVYRTESTDVAGLSMNDSVTVPVRLGNRYRIEISYEVDKVAADGIPGMIGIESGDGPDTFPRWPISEKSNRLTFDLVAGAATAKFNLVPGIAVMGYPVSMLVKSFVITRLEGPAVLQAVGREASITEHLDMACDSVGAVWRPTLDGTVEVIEGDYAGNVLGRLTDDPADTDALASYTKLEMGYAATDDLINELTVTNHGPSAETTRVFTNPASIAAHGRRSASIDLCLATSDLLDLRARELLDQASTPRWSPRSVTYAYEAVDLVPDLYDVIDVRRRGVTHRCLVLGIPHDLEPDPARPSGVKHFVTLTLRKVA